MLFPVFRYQVQDDLVADNSILYTKSPGRPYTMYTVWYQQILSPHDHQALEGDLAIFHELISGQTHGKWTSTCSVSFTCVIISVTTKRYWLSSMFTSWLMTALDAMPPPVYKLRLILATCLIHQNSCDMRNVRLWNPLIAYARLQLLSPLKSSRWLHSLPSWPSGSSFLDCTAHFHHSVLDYHVSCVQYTITDDTTPELQHILSS